MSKAHPRHSGTFREILLGVSALMRMRRNAVLIGILFFALVCSVGTTFVNERIHRAEEEIASQAGIPLESLLDEVTAKLEALKQEDLLLFALATQDTFLGRADVNPRENLALAYVVRVNPYLLGLLAFDILVFFGAFVYFLLLCSDPDASPYDSAKRLPLEYVRTWLLMLWLFVRSLVWIPIVGPALLLYFGPRLSLAPVISVRGEAGIVKSAKVSLARTRKLWARIFLWLLGLAFLSLFFLWIGLLLGGIFAVLSAKFGFFVWVFVVTGVTAFKAAFLTVMTRMIG